MMVKKKDTNKIKRLYRSNDDKKIFGICSGLGEYFGLDPTLIRIIWLLMMIFGGLLFLLIYLLLYLVIPTKDMSKKAPAIDFHSFKDRKIQRSLNDRMISGICGGFAKYLGVDPVIVRIVFVILDVITGFIPLIIVYLILIWIIPLNTDEIVTFKAS